MIERKIKRIFVLLNLFIVLFGFISINFHWFQAIDDFFYSKLFSSFVETTKPKGFDKTVLVSIDSKFFSKEGVTLSTFHRGYYAKLNEKLNNYGVENIVYDVFFQDLKYGSGNNIAQKLYKKSISYFDKKFSSTVKDNVVLGVLPSEENKVELPSRNLLEKGVWLGYVESHSNKNDINNGTYTNVVYSGNNILTLGFSAYFNRLYKQGKTSKNIDIEIKKNTGLLKYFSNDVLIIKTDNKVYKIPLSKDSSGEDFYLTPLFVNSSIKTYSLYDIIHDEDGIYEDKLKGKTIFVGATDTALNDIKMSYVGMIPGVMFHINNFLSIYGKNYFYTLPVGQSFIILIIMFIVGYFFVVLFKNEKLTFAVFFVLLFSLFIGYYAAFLSGIIIPVGTIIFIMLIKLIVDIIHILFINQEKRRFLSKLFDKYVGSKIREEKEESTKSSDKIVASTKNKNIALMFSDIASFTNISEKLEAEEVGDMLNIYFETCGQYLKESNAYVDKYIGDAIMAYWEDIEELDAVVKSVVNIQKAHPMIMLKVKEKLGKDIDIVTRIGLHYGKAIVGDIGDIHNKIQPTAIGDNVNLASRLEGINKYYNTHIIISEDFYKKIKNKENFAIRMLDKITVKGKTEPVIIYEVMEYFSSEINADIKQYIKLFEDALHEYFIGNFGKAQELFDRLYVLKLGKEDKVIKVFIERLEYLLKHKPENWDGVWRYSTK